jgi:hypothetical protein
MTLAHELAARAQAVVPPFVSVSGRADDMCILVSVRGARPDGISLFDDRNRPSPIW